MSPIDAPIPLTAEAITSGLQTNAFGKTVVVLDTVPSTNEFAKTMGLSESPHGTVVIAEEQQSGRGRLGRRWESPRSKNLLFSVLLRPAETDLMKASLIPFAAAVAVAEAIEAETGLEVECKWPNDLLIGKKKVCGMLIESSILGTQIEKLVLGIGINVNQEEIPTDILPHATSLAIETRSEHDRVRLLQQILSSLEDQYARLMNEPSEHVLDAWKNKTTMFGTRITVREAQRELSGIAEALSPDGSLVLRLDDGSMHVVRAGDVTLGYQQNFLHH